MSAITDPIQAAGEIPRALLQNTLANAASGYAGLAGAALPGPQGQGSQWQRRAQEAISFEPQSQVAKKALSLAAAPGEAYTKLISKPLGKRGAEVSPLLGAIGETSAEALPLLLGGSTKAAKPLTAAQQKVAAARDAGFTMTPEEMGAGRIPRTLASLAGEPRLAKVTSRKNAAVATEKAVKELGLPEGAALELDTLSGIRKAEGAKYEAVRKIGPVEMDSQYFADIDRLGAKYRSAAKDFPGLAKADVEQVVAALKREDPAMAAAKAQGIKVPNAKPTPFDANSAVDLIGQLRESADGAFRSGNAPLAKVYRGGADALEGQLERHLEKSGDTKTLADFRAARERIAKTYAVEKSLVGEQVNPQALGKQVQKRKPLTGGLKETGQFARDFERSSLKPSHMATGATIHDAGIALFNALRSGGASLARELPFLFARPAVREILASKPAQFAMDPRTNLKRPAMRALGASEAVAPPQKESK